MTTIKRRGPGCTTWRVPYGSVSIFTVTLVATATAL